MPHIADARGHCAHIRAAENADVTARRTRESRNDAQQRRFAGAVFAEQGVDASGGQRDAEIVKRREASEELAYALKDDGRFGMSGIKMGWFGMGRRGGMDF